MNDHESDLRTGAKAAAAAAAVGAAVGVARAIAARAEEAASRNGHERNDDEPVAEHDDDDRQDEDETTVDEVAQEDEDREPVRGAGVDDLRRLTDRARDLLEELSGSDVESVSAVERTGSAWRITLETVEVRRVPDSTDVLASYDVELDDNGDLVRYERGRRYSRSQSDGGSGR